MCALLVPLLLACIVLETDVPISREQDGRICYASFSLFLAFFLFEGASAGIVSGLFPRRSLLAKLVQFSVLVLACICLSCVSGYYLYVLSEWRWTRFALVLFG
jgi:hypothetical protein